MYKLFLTRNKIRCFFSYQFIENKKRILNYFKFINKINLSNFENKDIYFYMSEVEKIIIKKLYSNLKGKKCIGIFISGGIDSFLLLFYIRKNFPDIVIYTFTFFPFSPEKKHLLELLKISDYFNTIHNNIIENIDFRSIIKYLTEIYKKSNVLLGDEGLIYTHILIKKLKEHIDVSKIEIFMTGDGMDVLFGGMSMYRLSYLENNKKILKDKYFDNFWEKIYFKDKTSKYNKDFFYKYGEYFGGDFLLGGENKYLKLYYDYYDIINELMPYLTLLKKQIIFNYIFLISNRGNPFIKIVSKINNIKIKSIFFDKNIFFKILELNIPDKYLVNENKTKIIIRELANKVKLENNIDFDFLPSLKIDYFGEFNKNAKYIIYFAKYLFENSYITKEHYNLVPYFIKNGMWYENKIRIYLLLNLYFFIKFNI